METGEVRASYEAQLLKNKIIEKPFTAAQIANGALRDHLTQENYDAPLKVIFIVSHLLLATNWDQINLLSTHY